MSSPTCTPARSPVSSSSTLRIRSKVERLPEELAEAGLPPDLLVKALAATGALRLFGPEPPDFMPKDVRETVARHQPRSMTALLAEAEAAEQTFAQAEKTGPFGERPLVVLTAGRALEPAPPSLSEETVTRAREVWSRLQTELAQLSDDSRHRVVEDAGHYIQFDSPDAVVEAVREVLVTLSEHDAP